MRKNILLLCFSCVFALGVGELFCRIKGSYLSYNERTGASGYTSPFEMDSRDSTRAYQPYTKRLLKRNEFTDEWTSNADGLKEKNITQKKNKKRILILGDSFTEGVGAPPDSSYPRILETLLVNSNDSAEVINAGIGGSDIFFEYKLLQVLLPKYQPDVVIVTCNASDIFEYSTRGGFERFHKDGSIHYRNAPWFEPLYAHSLFARVFIHDVLQYDFNFIPKDQYNTETAKALQRMALAIDWVQLLCRQQQIPFGMVFHPFHGDFEYPETYLMKDLVKHCNQNHIPNVDALPYMQTKGINNNNWASIYWPMDGHFKPKGYALLANCTYTVLLTPLLSSAIEKNHSTAKNNIPLK